MVIFNSQKHFKTRIPRKLDSIYNALAKTRPRLPRYRVIPTVWVPTHITIFFKISAPGHVPIIFFRQASSQPPSALSFDKCCPVEKEIINGRDNPDGVGFFKCS